MVGLSVGSSDLGTTAAYTHLLRLARTLGDPLLGAGPIGVELQKAGLAAALDELVGLGNKL